MLEETRFSARLGIATLSGARVGLLEPLTYMNASGEAVSALLALNPDLEPARLIVVYDDLDLPFGRIRIRSRGGAGGQRGMRSILDAVGHDGVGRLRFGVGRPGSEGDPVEHVLSRFSEPEEAALPSLLDLACDAIELVFDAGFAPAMDRFNAPPPPDEGGDPT